MRTLVLHLVAVGVLLGLAVFTLQPVTGHIAFWTPAVGSLLIAASFLILAGCFVWWRFGSRRALIGGDMAALALMALVSLVVFFIPVTVVAAGMLLIGVAGARGHAGDGSRAIGTARVHPIALIAAMVLMGFFALSTFEAVLGDVAPFLDYGVTQVVLAGTFGLAVLFWLDGRPGALLGFSLGFLYFNALRLASVDEITLAHPEILVRSLVFLLASGVVALATALAIWERPPTGRIASLAVALIAVVAVMTVQPIAPLAVVASLAIERPLRTQSVEPVHSEPALAG